MIILDAQSIKNNLRVLNGKNQWKDKFHEFNAHNCVTCNKHSESQNKNLARGVGYVTNPFVSHKNIKYGKDPSSLGCWT